MSDEKPWEDYADPVAQQAPAATTPAAAPGVGYGEDIAKGAAGGLGRGTAGLVGLPGDLAEYGARGIDWAARKVGGLIGADVPTRAARAPTYGSADATKVLEGYTGPLYQPKTLPGQYASTIAEFAPAALVPGGGARCPRVQHSGSCAGFRDRWTTYQGHRSGAVGARHRGLVAGPLAAKAITPAAPASAARQAAVRTLEGEGIPLTAGQRTGSKPIQWMEANAADMPFSAGRAAGMNAAQAQAVDRAFTQRAFDPAESSDVACPQSQPAATGCHGAGASITQR